MYKNIDYVECAPICSITHTGEVDYQYAQSVETLWFTKHEVIRSTDSGIKLWCLGNIHTQRLHVLFLSTQPDQSQLMR
jgi:hypothetical protein